MRTALLLSAMMHLASPGVSPFSRVPMDLPPVVGACDEDCEDATIALYGSPPALDASLLAGRLVYPGWWRQESRAEAIPRWRTIALAVEAVRSDPPPRWPGSRRDLAVLLVVLGRAESAYWRPIHEGRLRGNAGEWGIWQCHPDLAGCDESLAGLDVASTERAARFAAGYLSSARRLAARDCPEADWVEATLRAYGSGAGCAGSLPDADKRLAWWTAASAAASRPPLPEAAEALP
jgi:hypothetical protein